jgi:hypothetical protein
MRSIGLSSGWLSVLVLSGFLFLPACDGGDTTGSGGENAGGGGDGGSSNGGSSNGGSSNGGSGGGGGAAFTCDDYCAAIDAINTALGCDPFDCSMTCPEALANFETQGCSAEGKAAFQCIQGTPDSSWTCDAASGLTYTGSECAPEVTALTDCQM